MSTMNKPVYRFYWIPESAFERVRRELATLGYTCSKTFLTPCQVLRAREKHLVFAPPGIWNGTCSRQGSWYLGSTRNGSYLLASGERLPVEFEPYLDAEMTVSDFQPDALPDEEDLKLLVEEPGYRDAKPAEWEQVRRSDRWSFKILFTLNRVWRRGDTLGRHWLGHRANHANFLTKWFATELDGERVAYSVTGNAGVCSSCAEFFNVIDPGSRKLVRACPGSITFGGAERDVYYDVRPTEKPN